MVYLQKVSAHDEPENKVRITSINTPREKGIDEVT
jgi:hypothetical protein